jgi:uncharacterized repeat protein (TIGR01451 family)
MRLCSFTRLLAAAGTVLLAAASARAFAAADVTVALTAPAGLDVGATNDYKAVLTNAGADAATNVVLTITLPAPLVSPTFSGCTQSPSDPSSCTLASLAAGGTQNVTISATYPVPTPYPTDCPNGAVLADAVTASVQADNDTTPSTSSVSGTTIDDFADVEAQVTPAEQGIASGGTVNMHGLVKNNGPCAANAVVVAFTFPTALGFDTATEATPFCGTGTILDAFNNFGCDLGNLNPGDQREFDSTFTLGALPKDLTNGAYRLEVDASADTHDPLPNNNSGVGTNRYSHDVGMCSIGGAGSVLSLLSLLALRLRRRRAS